MAGENGPYTLVLGIAQDGGVPQPGAGPHPAGPDFRRHAACLAIVDPRQGKRWLVDCTPDFREQLKKLDEAAPAGEAVLDGIFLTHAHIGHYTGLMFLGHEVMGAKGIPVHAMPKMAEFLERNAPWDQLIRYGNIALGLLAAGEPVALAADLALEPLLVPHRQEYSETVGYVIRGPSKSALYIPDIDSWDAWDAQGGSIEDWLAKVDVAYLDGSFFADGEIPGRDMSGFPHPFIAQSMERFAKLDSSTRSKVRFIHLNHTNPALIAGSAEALSLNDAGFRLAKTGECVRLGMQA